MPRKPRSDKGKPRGPRRDKLTRTVAPEVEIPELVPAPIKPVPAMDTTERPGVPVAASSGSLIERVCGRLNISLDDIRKYEAQGDRLIVTVQQQSYTVRRGDV